MGVSRQYDIPGMAIAITIDGRRYYREQGLASKASGRLVTRHTLFEIGSISKTFTATLATFAQAEGKLSLDDSPSQFLPSLQGSSLDRISLLNLATYTAGGLPLQVPDGILTNDQLLNYLGTWQPTQTPGTYRVYSNPSIGLLGLAAAASLQRPFETAIEKTLFPALGMWNSYINVPTERMDDYAQGYDKNDAPIRMSPGAIASEAYAIKSTSTDMIKFVEANMRISLLSRAMQRAFSDTHKGYFQVGEMTQSLVWEQYDLPLDSTKILAGNSGLMAYQPNKAVKIDPPLAPRVNVFINKTGSTNGFAAYVAYIPAKKYGIVILANKNYPIEGRVRAALQVLTVLDSWSGKPTLVQRPAHK